MGMRTGVDVQIARGACPSEYTVELTASGAGAASGTVELPDNCWLRQVEVVPGESVTAFTTLTVKNARGTDLLGGEGAGISVSENTLFNITPIWVQGNLTVAATGMGDSKTATVYVAVL